MNGNAVADCKLDLFAVDHLQRFAFLVVILGAERDPSLEDRWVRAIGRSVDGQLGLKDPRGVLVLLWLPL